MGLSRREILKSAAGAISGKGLDYSIDLDGNISDNPRKEQARYIAKSASKRSEFYDDLSNIFSVEDRASDLLEESVKPSIIDFIPGTAGDALDVVETVEWFENTRDIQERAEIAREGIKNPLTQDGTEAYTAFDGANEELQRLSERALDVKESAENYSVGDEWNKIHSSLANERSELERAKWIDKWTTIAPDEYAGPGESNEEAEKLKRDAKAASQALTGFKGVLDNQISHLEKGEYMNLPKMVAGINRNSVDNPGLLNQANPWSGDNFNLVVENNSNQELYRRWFETDDGFNILEYQLEGDTSAANIYIEEEDLNELLEEGASRRKIREMHGEGKIRVEGNGFSIIEYDAAIIGGKGLEVVGDGMNWIGERVDDTADFFRNLV